MANNNNFHISEIEKEKLLYESYKQERTENEREEDMKRTNVNFEGRNVNRKEDKKIEYDRFKNCIVKREFMANNIYKPFFSEIRNTYTRVSFPNGYAVCKIVDTKYDGEYKFPIGKYKFTTDIHLLVKHGDNKLKVPITYTSNTEITKEEFEKIRLYEDEDRIESEYKRVKRLFERKMSKEEEKKENDEKNKFMHGVGKRKSFYKMDILRKRKCAVNERNEKLIKEIDDAITKMNNDEMEGEELNAIGRRFNLKITGAEIETPQMKAKRDFVVQKKERK